jgi:hypothetical protein
MSFLILPRRFREQKEPHLLHYPAVILEAKYKVQICRNHEYVISEPLGPGFHKNLITNAGLDFVMQNGQSLTALITAGCRVGSGTNPPANTDTALQTGLKGTQTNFTGGGIQAVNDTVNGAVAFTNVYEFAAEVGSVTYNELGIANSGSPTGGTQMTRALFGSPINLTSGQNLRLTYTLNISCPATVTSIPVSLAAVNGFNISGNMRLCGTFSVVFGSATSSAISGANDGAWRCAMATASNHAANFLSAPTTFPAVNTSLAGTLISSSGITAASQSTYTNGSFTRNCTYVWNPSTPPSTVSNIAGIFFTTSTANTTQGVYLLLSSAQTKANTNTLTVTLSSSVARA